MTALLTRRVEPNRRLAAMGLDGIPATTGDVLAATARETWVRNPLPSIARAFARGRQYTQDDFLTLSTTAEDGPDTPQVRVLSAQEANEQYGIKGELSFDRSTPLPVAQEMFYLKRDELERRDVLRRAKGGAGQALATFGVGLGVSALDPLNIASAFIPVVSQARYGIWLNQARTAGQRAGVRAGVGAAEGAAGALALEPLVYGVAASEQADYDAVDSMLNVAFGTALGGGLHVAAGGVGELRTRRERRRLERLVDDARKQAPQTIEQAVDDAPVVVQEQLLKQGVADLVETGHVENVQAVADNLLPPVGDRPDDASPMTPGAEAPAPGRPAPDVETRTGALAPVRRLIDYVFATRLPLDPQTVAAATGLTPRGVVRMFQNMTMSGRLLQRGAKYRRVPKSDKPQDALEFLASKGGLRDDEGHLLRQGMDAPKMTPAGPLIRKTGRGIDEAGEILHEAGYFGPMESRDRPTEDEVLDLLARAFAGEKIWSDVDTDEVMQLAWMDEYEDSVARAEMEGAVEAEDIGDTVPGDDADWAQIQLEAEEASARTPEDALALDDDDLAQEIDFLRSQAEESDDPEINRALEELDEFSAETDALARGAEAVGLCRRIDG